jgi:hypothetical protein
MSRKYFAPGKQFAAAALLALSASGTALADGNSMNRFGGESYAYFNHPALGGTSDSAAWRRSHPNGLSETEIQAMSASDLSIFASKLNPPVFANVAADASWRQSHPNGLTESELQALSASSLAMWKVPDRPETAADQSHVAQSSETLATRLANFFHRRSDAKAGIIQ